MQEKRFFGQRIRVTCARDAAGFLLPAEFALGDDTIRVQEVLLQWHDSGFASTSTRRTWLDRRHRTHYRIRAADGCVYELYVDRTGNRRDWYLMKQLPGPTSPDRADAAHE
jgi:hypothetical protein